MAKSIDRSQVIAEAYPGASNDIQQQIEDGGGLVCEQHPHLSWPHDNCSGPGMLASDAVIKPVINHVTVECTPAQAWKCRWFYDVIIGLTEKESPVPNSAWFEEGVHIFWGSRSKARVGKPLASHIALVLGNRYRQVRNNCAKNDLLLTDGTNYWGSERCYVMDPANNRLELMEYGPK